jgi:predicted dehydrogenase
MRALVIGYGSIGQRHTRILKDLDCETAVVSRRVDLQDAPRGFPNLGAGLAGWRPEYVVIANETSAHHAAVKELATAGYAGRVLVEKPLFERVYDFPGSSFRLAAVAYNLRFHPVVGVLREALMGRGIREAELHVGQWLPDWRPSADYRNSYSAKKSGGGGVLRDLSHELDLALHLFGPWASMTATGGHSGALEIETEDNFEIRLQTTSGASVRIVMNYLDRPPQRTIAAKSDAGTFHADLLMGTLENDGKTLVHSAVGRDDTYRSQHLAMINGDATTLCTVEEGLDVVRMIEAAERSNAAGSTHISAGV